jgi:DNA-binding transcriptional MerR regulator
MAQQQPVRRKMQSSKIPVSIPDKLYFRIGDVARLCSLPAYVLRFWETEFAQLKPNKGGTGQRLYRKRDVEMVLEIKHLLYDEGFTIAGARRLLTEKRRSLASSVVSTAGVKEKYILTANESEPAVRGQSKMSKAAPSKQLPNQPKIKELREEMRELLTLLGSDPRESNKPLPLPARRDTKKTRRADEPTLF